MTSTLFKHAARLGSGKTELIKASVQRPNDAEVLMRSARFRGAMYMAGYAIECRMKAKLLVQHNVGSLDQLKRKMGVSFYVHDLERLGSSLSGWRRVRHNMDFKPAWDTVRAWKVDWRYEREFSANGSEIAGKFMDNVEVVLRCIENSI